MNCTFPAGRRQHGSNGKTIQELCIRQTLRHPWSYFCFRKTIRRRRLVQRWRAGREENPRACANLTISVDRAGETRQICVCQEGQIRVRQARQIRICLTDQRGNERQTVPNWPKQFMFSFRFTCINVWFGVCGGRTLFFFPWRLRLHNRHPKVFPQPNQVSPNR